MDCQTSDVHHDDLHHEPEKPLKFNVKDGSYYCNECLGSFTSRLDFTNHLPSCKLALDQCQGEVWPAPTPVTFQVKDSGQRQEFSSGMVRDVATDKVNIALVLDGPMFWRWAVHLTKGAVKYTKRNWMKAAGEEEHERFRESAVRHFIQWYRGEEDEDHASAVFFNINGAEYVKGRKK